MRSPSELLQNPRALKALVAVGSLLTLLVVGVVLAPTLVRGKVLREARDRGFETQVGGVGFGASGVWLRELRVTSPGDDFEMRLDGVRIGWLNKSVRAYGGTLRGSGDPERVVRKVRREARSGSGGAESVRDLSVEGLFVSWENGPSRLYAFGARARHGGGESSFGADLVRILSAGIALETRGLVVGAVVREGRRRLTRVEASTVDLALLSRGDALAAPDVGARSAEQREVEEDVEGSRAARLRRLRDLLLPLVRDALSSDARLMLDGVSARIERSGETLSFGPSRLVLQRSQDNLRISLTPSAAEVGVTPLAVSLSMTLAPGPVHVVAKGGPVSFASLGVRAGQVGVQDVRHATLGADGSADFSEDFENVSLEGKLAVRGLSIDRRELSPQVVGPWGFDVALKALARVDGSELAITSSEARVGELRAELSGRVAAGPDRRHVEGRLRVPLSGCQSLLQAVPRGLLPLVGDMRLGGSFGIDLQVRYDLHAPKDTHVVLAVQNECRIQSVPGDLSPDKFMRPFLREAKAADGSVVTIEGGPGTPSWVAIEDISRHMETAVLICEDSRFHTHGGFDFHALENAIKDDLRAGRFARGASTVSMQLAKNLYLGKEKTLGRKLQEALLTMLLEQELNKVRILELYLNVVELGPGLYGVGDAAQYYFATSARELSLGQALYLASILPNPTYSHFRPDGKLSPKWQSYLRRLMHIAHKIKRVDAAELESALVEQIAFRVPGAGVSLGLSEPRVDGLRDAESAEPEPPPRENAPTELEAQ